MLKIYTDFVEDLEPLTDAEIGRLFVAMLNYAADETEPELNGNERITWATARKHIRAQWTEYRNMCERNKENISKRYEPLRLDTTSNDALRETTTGNKNKNKNKNNIFIERENLTRENLTDESPNTITETIRRLTEAM